MGDKQPLVRLRALVRVTRLTTSARQRVCGFLKTMVAHRLNVEYDLRPTLAGTQMPLGGYGGIDRSRANQDAWPIRWEVR